VIGGSLPAAMAADWLTSAWDQNAGLYATSPASAVVEEVAAAWLVDLLGLPKTAGIGFVTGCQMANATGLAAGRHAVLRRVGWDVEQQGLAGAPPVTVVVGEEAHVTIHSALRLLGLGSGRALRVKADGQGRMVPEDLRRVLAPVTGPTIVCAQAGNVNTGAFDDLAAIAPIVRERERGAWLHVDGAFGLWAAASPRLRDHVRGIAEADSWATDAHKWLNVPYDCGIVFVADAAAQRAAMGAQASTSSRRRREREPFSVAGFSRRARGFTVYAALRSLGRQGVADLVDRCCRSPRGWRAASRGRPLHPQRGRAQPGSRSFGPRAAATPTRSPRPSSGASATDVLARRHARHGVDAMRISVSNWSRPKPTPIDRWRRSRTRRGPRWPAAPCTRSASRNRSGRCSRRRAWARLAHGVDTGARPAPSVRGGAAAAKAAADLGDGDVAAHAAVAPWRVAYGAFGVKPSVPLVIEPAARRGPAAWVPSTLVDAYNAVSPSIGRRAEWEDLPPSAATSV
jgi:hypothetical protein